MSTVPPPPPDVLDSAGGEAIPPGSPRPRRPLLRGLLIGVVVVLLGAAGYGAWAAYSFFQTGPQPAQALPASTLGYVSVDLDPSGGQKIEALRTLNKFPAFKDKVGITSSDDLRQKLFELLQGSGPDACQGLSFDQDIKPWLGQRAAVASVDTAGKVVPVVVMQVTDDDQAETGLKTLRDCSEDSDRFAWHVDGDWALIAEGQATVDAVAKQASSSSLADDSDFQHWSDEVGDPGVVSMYAAPAAGDYLADHVDQLTRFPVALAGGNDTSSTSAISDSLKERLRDFRGAAATVRFADGGVELAVASDSRVSQGAALGGGAAAGDLVRSLPADTGAAFGLGFQEGWFADALDQLSSYTGQSASDLESTVEQATGLSLPQDVETLTGRAAVLAVGSGLTVDSLTGADPSQIQVALKVQGDPDAIKAVLAKITGQADAAGLPEGVLGSDSNGDDIAIGPDGDYRADVVKDGSLGEDEVFKDVVPDANKASAILYVNLDQYDDLLQQATDGDAEALANLEPLSGLGMAGWTDGDTAHLVFRVSTD